MAVIRRYGTYGICGITSNSRTDSKIVCAFSHGTARGSSVTNINGTLTLNSRSVWTRVQDLGREQIIDLKQLWNKALLVRMSYQRFEDAAVFLYTVCKRILILEYVSRLVDMR